MAHERKNAAGAGIKKANKRVKKWSEKKTGRALSFWVYGGELERLYLVEAVVVL